MDFYHFEMNQNYDSVPRLKFYMSKKKLIFNITASVGIPQELYAVSNFIFSQKKRIFEKSS